MHDLLPCGAHTTQQGEVAQALREQDGERVGDDQDRDSSSSNATVSVLLVSLDRPFSTYASGEYSAAPFGSLPTSPRTATRLTWNVG